MAMSDWDCLAYGPDGRCCGGTFSILGIEGGISKASPMLPGWSTRTSS